MTLHFSNEGRLKYFWKWQLNVYLKEVRAKVYPLLNKKKKNESDMPLVTISQVWKLPAHKSETELAMRLPLFGRVPHGVIVVTSRTFCCVLVLRAFAHRLSCARRTCSLVKYSWGSACANTNACNTRRLFYVVKITAWRPFACLRRVTTNSERRENLQLSGVLEKFPRVPSVKISEP